MSRLDDVRGVGADRDPERDVLLRARAGLSPSAADAERVRRTLAAALAVGPSASPSSTGAPAAATQAGAWGRRLLAGAAIAALAGGGGYILGHRAGRRVAALTAAPAFGASDRAPIAELPPEVRREPSGASVAPVDTSARPAAPTARRHASPTTALPLSPPPTPGPSLEEEVRGVRAIERALREGSPSLALALLGELDRTVPEGRLLEERAATSAIARCALGHVPFGVDLAAEFGERYPESAYLKRVRQSCAEPPAK